MIKDPALIQRLSSLPVFSHLDEISKNLQTSGYLVLTAETGAGKSTAVPLVLLHDMPGKILMLEPRRLAALAVASRMADLLDEPTGKRVGYRLRMDTNISSQTRIEVMTEAVLTRMIQADPALEGVSAVILDEFHERTIHGDLALALLREVKLFRPELAILIMSATINSEDLSRRLQAPVLSISGRMWPVDIIHRDSLSFEQAIINELQIPGGDLLVFLPGIGEIRRCLEHVRTMAITEAQGRKTGLYILHSSVSIQEQRLVLSPAEDERRVILASAIAETSVTVPGVTTVIDCGLSRINRFDIRTGMDRLVTVNESAFSAAQRAGRAGRTGPGRCIRLWNPRDTRPETLPPEIERSDIIPLVLECAQWGVHTPDGLDWLDSPNAAAWEQACSLLQTVGALDSENRITDFGRALLLLAIHPRLGCVALSGYPEQAVRYLVRSADSGSETGRYLKDLYSRLDTVANRFPAVVQQLNLLSTKTLTDRRKTGKPAVSPAMALLAGFPDRLALHAGDGTYRFPSGRQARIGAQNRKEHAVFPKWIVVAEVDAGDREGRIYEYESLSETEVLSFLEKRTSVSTEVSFTEKGIRKIETVCYGGLVLSSKPVQVLPEDSILAWCDYFRKQASCELFEDDAVNLFLLRARFAWRKNPESPATETVLLANLEKWLVPFITGSGKPGPEQILAGLRWYCDASFVDREAPCKICLASGRIRPLNWEMDPVSGLPKPVLETRVQDLYGCAETPAISGVPVLLRLLSPAGRPVQVTSDLAGFWQGSWTEVRREMKGRYPKHDWPEKPV